MNTKDSAVWSELWPIYSGGDVTFMLLYFGHRSADKSFSLLPFKTASITAHFLDTGTDIGKDGETNCLGIWPVFGLQAARSAAGDFTA